MSMTAVKIPQIVLDLRANLTTSDLVRRMDCVAPIVRLPKYSDVPRPGECADWSFRQWKEWAKRWDFEEGEATHAFMLRHSLGVIFSMSKTPGDPFSGMASCTQFRRQLATVLDNFALVVVNLIDQTISGQNPDAPVDESPSAFLDWLLAAVIKNQPNKGYLLNLGAKSVASDADREAWSAIPGVLKTIDKEFGVSPRQALSAVNVGSPDSLLMCMRDSSYRAYPRAGIILIELRAIIDENRARRKGAADMKAAARKAEREAREAQKDPATRQKYDKDVTDTRSKIRTHFATQLTIAENLVNTCKRNLESIHSIPFPDYPGAPAELIAKNEAIALALDEAMTDRDALRERVAADATAIAKLETDLLAATKRADDSGLAGAARKQATELVTYILSKLTTNDIFKLPNIIKDVCDRARELQPHLTKE